MPSGGRPRSSGPCPPKPAPAGVRPRVPDHFRGREDSFEHQVDCESGRNQKRPLCPESARGESATTVRSTPPGCEESGLPDCSETFRFRKRAGLTLMGRSLVHTFVELSELRGNGLLPKIQSRCPARPAPCTGRAQNHWRIRHAVRETPAENSCRSIPAAREE